MADGYTNLTFASHVDWEHIDKNMLTTLNQIAVEQGVTIDVFSGYRAPAYSQKVGGYSNDPHTRHVAVDANVGGKPIGEVIDQSVFARYGLESGNQPNFYKGRPDPSHVQAAGSGVDKSITSYTGGGGSATSHTSSTPASPRGADQASVFSSKLAAATGLDPNVIKAMTDLEGAYAPNGTGGFNYLNVRPAPGGKSYSGVTLAGVSSGSFQQFRSLDDAVKETAYWLNKFANYKGIRAAKGKGAAAQIAAIVASPWDQGHYGGNGSTFRAAYDRVMSGGGVTATAAAPATDASDAAVAPAEQTPSSTAPPVLSSPSMAPPPGLELPGSVPFTLDHRQVASTWQSIAEQFPSPETQQFAYLSGLGQ